VTGEKPRRVDDCERYWGELPDEPSPRCIWWIARIKSGWQPNRRIRSMGYYGSAEWYGVYIEEFMSVLSPLLRGESSAMPSIFGRQMRMPTWAKEALL